MDSIADILSKYGEKVEKNNSQKQKKVEFDRRKMFDLFLNDEKKYYEELEKFKQANSKQQQEKQEEEKTNSNEDEFEKNNKIFNYVFSQDLNEFVSRYGTKIPAVIYFVNGYFNYCKNKNKACFLTKQQIFDLFNKKVSISTIKAAIRILKCFGLVWQKRFLKSFRECKYEIVWTKEEEYDINKIWIDIITEKLFQLNTIGKLKEQLTRKQISKNSFIKKKKAIRGKSFLNFTFRCWTAWFHKFKKLSILRTEIFQNLKEQLKLPNVNIVEILKSYQLENQNLSSMVKLHTELDE